jgi:cyclohexanone monooxygenase
VTEAAFDYGATRWTVRTDRGDALSARFCIMATGCLSVPQDPPPFPGIKSFTGRWYHTGRWPHEGVDFTGQRVAVIGTGSSAIQSIPVIAEQAAQLWVFQRTANFSIPAHNRPLDPDDERRVKAEYPEFRRSARESRIGFVVPVNDKPALSSPEEERRAEYEARWQRGGLGFGFSFSDLLVDEKANVTAAEFFREQIRSIVRDPRVAERSEKPGWVSPRLDGRLGGINSPGEPRVPLARYHHPRKPATRVCAQCKRLQGYV